jgi:hypothetical protein
LNRSIQGQTQLIELPTISLWQPWASWVAWGWKTIETRTHNRFASLIGQRIGIHAAKTFDPRARNMAGGYLSDGQARSAGRSGDTYPRGIICTALVKDYRVLIPDDAPRALIECRTLRFGLFLEEVHKIDPPLRCKGRQGIWREICPSSVHGSYVTGVSLPKPSPLSKG